MEYGLLVSTCNYMGEFCTATLCVYTLSVRRLPEPGVLGHRGVGPSEVHGPEQQPQHPRTHDAGKDSHRPWRRQGERQGFIFENVKLKERK